MTSKTTELSLDEIFNLAKASLLKHGANEENAVLSYPWIYKGTSK